MASEPFAEDTVSVYEGIARVLEQAGIDMVFGVPAGYLTKMYNLLYDHQSTIKVVLVREESLAGVMAEVYGRLTGKPGVVIGQGAFVLSNALLGTLEAHLGSSPMLLLADLTDGAPYSQHAPYQSGSGEYGSFDASRSFAGVTKLTTVAHEPVQAIQQTQLAIKHALSGQPGPVAVLYSRTALNGAVGPDSRPRLYSTRAYLPAKSERCDDAQIDSAAAALLKARRPVIISGNGVRVSRAYLALQELAELLEAPVATTASGKGTFDETHRLALGPCGNFGRSLANQVIGDADVVLIVGSKIGPHDTANEHDQLLNPKRQTLIQIDIEPLNAAWTFPAEHVVIGDASVALVQLIAALTTLGPIPKQTNGARRSQLDADRSRHGWFDVPESRSDEVPILPQRLIKDIHEAIPKDAFIACDAGENRIFMNYYYQVKEAGGFLQPAASGGMGYAIPAALAAQLISPRRSVLAVCGDGGFAMAMNGLMTAREHDLPIVTVVFNNGALGWVLHGQGDKPIASTFPNYDYAAIARSMGCEGIRVEKPADIQPALRAAFASRRPTVVDVVTSLSLSFAAVTSSLASQAVVESHSGVGE